MQSGGGTGGGAGRGRMPPPPLARPPSSSSPSPSSSSSAVSVPPAHLVPEAIQQQQQQQLAFRQLQQHHQQSSQQLRRPEGDDTFLAYEAGRMHGVMVPSSSSSSPMTLVQPRKFGDLSSQVRQENQSNGPRLEQPASSSAPLAYLQFAMQAAHNKPHVNITAQHHGQAGLGGPISRDKVLHLNSSKMQDIMPLQTGSQARAPLFMRSADQLVHGEKQMEQVRLNGNQQNELKPPLIASGQSPSLRPVQSQQSQAHVQSIANNQLLAQFQVIQSIAQEHNIDLSIPGNLNIVAQLIPTWQSTRLAAPQRHNEAATAVHQLPSSKQQVIPSPVGSENSVHGNSVSDGHLFAQGGPMKILPGPIASSDGTSPALNYSATGVGDIQMQQQQQEHQHQQMTSQTRENQIAVGNGGSVPHLQLPPGNISQGMERSHANISFSGPDTGHAQYIRSLQQKQPAISSNEVMGPPASPLAGNAQLPHQNSVGFTKQQLHVLKAQILAFRRLKRGERSLPHEVLQAISPPPYDLQLQQAFHSPAMVNQENLPLNNVEKQTRHIEAADNVPQLSSSSKIQVLPKEEMHHCEENPEINVQSALGMQGASYAVKEHAQPLSVEKVETGMNIAAKTDLVERGSQELPMKGEIILDKGKAVPSQTTAVDAGAKNSASISSTPTSKDVTTRKYHGPIFDFPLFARRHDSVGANTVNKSSNLTLAYDMKDILFEEGRDVLNHKRRENLRKINSLLAFNLERKRIRPDIVLRLQIEEKKLRLLDFQARLRDEVDQQQQEIMAMSDRPYRKFVRQCERQRVELSRQVQQLQKATREKQLKSIFQWRKKLLETHWAIRDARTTRNRGVAKYHEKMLREFSKRKDEDRTKRMEALKNNDVDRYREMLLEQQTNIPGDAAQRYSVLSSFLSQTEEYLHKLGGKITAAKNHQEVEEAANVAATAARSQGLSDEEVRAAAACAGDEVMIRNRFLEMNAPKDSSSNKYYNLAHVVNERVLRQPSMLRAGTLRDYQIVGLQWMLSLYNNKLNGILADEMGLGKTVQVMSLIAYLMEFKGNYGPHLIIVPNAVLVNWKSELLNWLPSVSCIFYVGGKDQRSKLFSHEVCAVKFNVLVTTYEFVMYDRSKLSKIDWKYIIIDEAQRMKDRESVLARDLDRYRCQRRLLLTGTPLQNDLKELWSLLNLLLPEVFDNRKAFHDWFSKPFQKDSSHSPEEDDWLETEKKVIVIHRLHQILEPFMLRRRVEEVEGSLPRKISIVLRCRMSAIQSCIYDWVKSTGTIRVDPEDELRKLEKNSMYHVKTYKNLQNKCMELRKVCNHPLLNYPYFSDYSRDFVVKSCGKLWILDRILIKLHRAGHRVLLFSTMTKLLDILEEYLQWRRLIYRRIDGTTSLEDRESAIVDFNSVDSNCFIFLLSIRAAGRGLNLQTADTVVIYDPDPNPQNEEQAVARAHRIGQRREVKVIYLEAVVDKASCHEKEDELRNGGTLDSEDDLAGKDRYMGSIESLIRNNIQQYKIDMADEVINAGRFDQRTTHEERRLTLETLLHDDERYQENVHDVPSLQEVNRMIARSDEEIELFDQLDEEYDWPGEMMKYNQVPKWLRAGSREVNAIASLSKKPSKKSLPGNIDLESSDPFPGLSPNKTERRGRQKVPLTSKGNSVYVELDEYDVDFDANSEEENGYSLQDEEGEVAEFEDDEFNGTADPPENKDLMEEDQMTCNAGNFFSGVMEGSRSVPVLEEVGSSGSSSGCARLPLPSTPSMTSQKFGSLSALDARPDPLLKNMPDDLEEGEIAASGDSYTNFQHSGSWIHDRDDNEEEQVLQPTIKRKRSLRVRPRQTMEKLEYKSSNERLFRQRASQMPIQVDHDYDMVKTDQDLVSPNEPVSESHEIKNVLLKNKRDLPSRKTSHAPSQQSGRLNSCVELHDNFKGILNNRTAGTSIAGNKMSDSMQRKCKNVISKLQRRIDKDGQQSVPILFDWWKRNENPSGNAAASGGGLLNLRKIDQRVDSLEYNGVMEFIVDVQTMLKKVVQCCGCSYDARYEARKVHDVFFDIMKIAFPDTDFREAKNAVNFSGLGVATVSTPSLKPAAKATTQPKLLHRPHSNLGDPSSAPARAALRGAVSSNEDGKAHIHAPKPLEAHGSGPFLQLLVHPGNLVTCKKKRKDRDKPSIIKQRIGGISSQSWPGLSSASGRLGSANPPSRGSGTVSFQRDSQPNQPTTHPGVWGRHPTPLTPPPAPQKQQQQQRSHSPSVTDAQWAKPVKRTRSDSGKRRPFQP